MKNMQKPNFIPITLILMDDILSAVTTMNGKGFWRLHFGKGT